MNGYPAVREKQAVTDKVVKHLKSLPGCYAIKVHQSEYSVRGTPDVDAAYRGRAIKIECKRPGEEPRPSQLNEMRKWREAGAVVACVHSLDELKAVMREHFSVDG